MPADEAQIRVSSGADAHVILWPLRRSMRQSQRAGAVTRSQVEVPRDEIAAGCLQVEADALVKLPHAA